MAPVAESPNRADVNDTGLTGTVVAVTSSAAVELKVGTTRNANRQLVTVTNDSNTVSAYLGPSTVTATGSTKGDQLWPRQSAAIPIGDVGLYAITASGESVNLIVQEYE